MKAAMTKTLRIFGVLALLAVPALAETGVRFDGLKTDPTAPIEVQADQLSVNQADGLAVFTGNVVVLQSDMELTAAEVTVIYAADNKGIAELHARGGVTVKAGTNVAQAEEAAYVVATAELVLQGQVLLSQGQATLSGQVLRINLTTGLGTIEGRVTTTFAPGGD
jgi:lipopolysaccharide export system protein LptA